MTADSDFHVTISEVAYVFWLVQVRHRGQVHAVFTFTFWGAKRRASRIVRRRQRADEREARAPYR